MREKLVGLICDSMQDGCVGWCNKPPCYRVERVVDHLITNGVTIPVRCKDCRYVDTFYPEKPIGEEARQVWFCKLYKHTRKPDEHCSDGERRSDDRT